MNKRSEALKSIIGQANELGYVVIPAGALQDAVDQVASAVCALKDIQQKYQETQDLLVELLVVIDGSEGEHMNRIRELILGSAGGATALPGA